MSGQSSSSSGGVGFVGLLTILFIGLKLTKYIDWSWWWVLSPIWISASIVLGILLIVFVFHFVKNWIKVSKRKSKLKKS